MALGQMGKAALLFTFPGLLAFIFGIIAENKKPTGDLAQQFLRDGGITVCKYPKDPSIVLGSLSIVFLFISTVIAVVSITFPYQGKRISAKALSKSKTLVTFFVLTLIIFLVSEALLLWATILEGLHRKNNAYLNLVGSCPTAKAGLFGGAAMLSLDSTLFWLICLMLTANVREDHFGYDPEEDVKGNYGDVTVTPTLIHQVA